MADLLRMPEVAAGADSAVLSSWSIAEGASFSAGEVIAVIETDKAIVDYEAETSGVLVRRLAHDGAEIAVGAPIALIGAAGEQIADVDAALAVLGFESSAAPAPAAPAPAAPPAAPVAPAAPSAPVTAGAVVEPVHAPAPVPAPSGGERVFISPLARKLARESGVDIATVTGSGPGGRIVRRDIEAAVGSGVTSRAAAPQAAEQTSRADVTEIPHTRLRRAIANRLTESKTTAPHFYVRGTARVDDLLRMREQINSGGDVRVSVNDLLIKAMGRAHVLVPGLNVTWSADAIRQYSSVDISVAISTDNGLVTPVVRGVERLSVSQISVLVRDFAERARAGRLAQSELEGGSASISNLGMFGTQEFAAIINPPQASILAVGAAQQAPVVVDGAVVVANVLTVTLSVDHRPVDGVLAAQWMKVFIDLLENPARILA